MKKIAIVLAALLFQFALQAQEVLSDANVTPRTIDSSFDNVKVAGNIKLILSQGEAVSLAVSAAQEKYIGDIKTVVENSTLRIYASGENNWARKREYTVYLGFKQIAALAASGACNIKLMGTLLQKELKVDLSGASNLQATLDVEALTIALSGASEAKLAGRARQFNINSSGASDVNAYAMETDSCSAAASGASDLRVNVKQELDAVASGASHIYFKGVAHNVNSKSSGVSKIERLN